MGLVVTIDSKAIRDDTAYLERALECSPFGIIICNKWLRVVLVNEAAVSITGLSREKMTGRKISGIFGTPVVKEFVENAGGDRNESHMDAFISIRMSGVELTLRVVVSAVHDEMGGFMGVLVFLDRMENLRKLNRDIIRAERVSAIKEAAISINHEINNPLCSILGNTQLLLMDRDNLAPAVVEKLERIEEDISRIHDIAEKLAKITKPVIGEYVGGARMIDIEKSSV